MLDLYIRRANLMPVFFTAARKLFPIPPDIYTRFIKARDRFAEAGRIKDISLANEGIRSANAVLDVVFADFFAAYQNCREPLYIMTHEDYTKIMEKIHFNGKFYEDAWIAWKRVSGGPLRFGVIFVKKWGKYVE
jgi:hypothetical protein